VARRIDAGQLVGSWVHSHEEDTPTSMVFRRPSYAFPPSRGRMSIALTEDGGLTVGGPGADDRRTDRDGRWTLDGDQLELSAQTWLSGQFDIEELGSDRLVLHRR
jgi:hypothetical protein